MVGLGHEKDRLLARLDQFVEALDARMTTIVERLDAHTREMRELREAIVQEHRADRQLMYSILGDHWVRLEDLEKPRAEG